ncbi:MAG: hypothetical protein ACTHJQ_25880 [Rhizobiaceae bacterium]
MPDKLALWNQSLIHLGKASITALTDDVEAVYVFGNAWAGVLMQAFNAGDWNVFKKSGQLSASGTGTAAIGWSYVFDYPTDYLRTVAVSPYAGFEQPFYDYVDEGGFLSSNTKPIYLRYISNTKMTDDAVASWPEMFWRYVAMLLAYETCDKLTNGATKQADLENRLKKALRDAKSVDARNENRPMSPGSWLRSRRGYGVGSGTNIGVTVGGDIQLGEGDV